MTTRFKRWIKNSDTLLILVPLLIVVIIIINFYIIHLGRTLNNVVGAWEESIPAGLIVTVACLVPPFFLIFLPIKLNKWWKESAKW